MTNDLVLLLQQMCSTAKDVIAEVERLHNDNIRLRQLFCDLRYHWFVHHVRRRAHEREWETPEQERDRARSNAMLRAVFDERTKQILCGSNLSVAPMCDADMDDAAQETGGEK